MVKSIEKIVFSPTGGTQKIADIIVDTLTEFEVGFSEIDLSAPFIDENGLSIDADALAIIAMPCFGGRAPIVAIDRLSRIRGNGAKAVVVMVYGNRDFDDALLELKNEATNAGFQVIACIAAVAEHSIMHQFATGRPDATDVKALRGFAQTVLTQFEGEPASTKLKVPGNEPYLKAGSVPLVPKVTRGCVSCGECAKRCPVTAINTADYAADKSTCIACMRCIQICPQQARSISKTMVKVAALAIKKSASVRKECELFI